MEDNELNTEVDEMEDDIFEVQQDEQDEVASTSSIPEEFVEIARKYRAGEPLSDEELDAVADTAVEVLRTLLGFFDAADADIDEFDGSEGELILDVNNADLAVLIGRHGRTLEALQYLFSLIVNRKLGFRYPVSVDIEGYRNRRRQKLEGIANNAAHKALSRGCDVRLHPMKAYERRIIHLILRSNDEVTTHSEGVEPSRYVVVSPRR